MTKKMAGNLQPLVNNQRIVKQDGTPTDYFIRWAQQKQIDIGAGITAQQALEIITKYLADHELQAGSGIQITPSGNISDSPTIAAEVQAILDQITDVRGSVLFRGAAGWEALGPGPNGHFLRTNGAGANPSWAAGGGGGGGLWWFNPPVAADFPTFGSYDATMPFTFDNPNSGMVLRWTGNYVTNDSSKGCFKALPPGVDWQVITHWGMSGVWTNFAYGGVALRNSVTNRAFTIAQPTFAASAGYFLIGQNGWTAQALGNIILGSGNGAMPMHTRLSWVSATTTLNIEFSYDGESWINRYSTNVAASLGTPDLVGFKLHSSFAAAAVTGTYTDNRQFLTVDRWEQSW